MPECAAASAGILRHQQRGIAADLRAIVARRPRDQDLRFGEQQRAKAVGLDLQIPDVGAQPRLVAGRADPRAHQQDRGHHRKAEQRQRGGQHREFLAVEIEAASRSPDRPLQIAGMGRRDRQQRRHAKRRSGRRVPVMCTTARSDASPRSRPTWFAPNRTTLRPARFNPPFANRITISPSGLGG